MTDEDKKKEEELRKEKEKAQEKADAEDEKRQNDVDKSEDMIDKANDAAERLEQINQKLEVNLERHEKLKVEEILGGKSEAGKEKKEETPEEYKNKIMDGSDDRN